MRFASLGSGSQGNALIVDAGDTKLLVDCGFSTRATIERLARLSVRPEDISAVLVTHEHSDHVSGVPRFASRFKIPVYLTHGAFQVLYKDQGVFFECRLVDSHAAFAVKGVEVSPFPVPHDAREPVQYTFSNGLHHLGLLTDSGSITPHIISVLKVCHALILECNYAPDLLETSSYPSVLKQRISGKLGHLANEQAGSLLRAIGATRLQHIIAAHLSQQNNLPERAVRALADALGCTENWIGVAHQEKGFAWRELF